ncbi:MAG: DNA-directed RNA polymerase subunit omega [Nitrospiraceae bacterium]|nr:DNA-directed RNA polymerase subunit omega [Nitrospiraceae bacterium]
MKGVTMGVLSLLDHHSNTKIDSRFRIVIIAVQRAKQLLHGAAPISQKPFAKKTCLAIHEVVQDEVDFVINTEARLLKDANEQAQKHATELSPSEKDLPLATTNASATPAKSL